jgi:hypothetical protein
VQVRPFDASFGEWGMDERGLRETLTIIHKVCHDVESKELQQDVDTSYQAVSL